MNLHKLATIYNFLVIPFWLFTQISTYDPVVFSNLGVISILLWGMAYSSVPSHSRMINFVFFLEKMVYVYYWSSWLFTHDVMEVFKESETGGLIMASYGFVDLLFGLMFLTRALKEGKGS